jgi:uncharacterized protein (TIGR02246 family)
MHALSIIASLMLLAGQPALGQTSLAPGESTTPATPIAGVEQQVSQKAGTTPLGSDGANHAQDEAAIRKIVADGVDAWNRSGAKTLLAHLAEDSDHINVAGKWSSGRDRIEKAMSDFFATHRPPSVTRPIEKIRFITPEVAVLVIRNKYANDKKAWEAMSISVFRKMNGEWWNEAFQNTLIQSREEAIAQAARANGPMA